MGIETPNNISGSQGLAGPSPESFTNLPVWFQAPGGQSSQAIMQASIAQRSQVQQYPGQRPPDTVSTSWAPATGTHLKTLPPELEREMIAKIV